MGFVVEAGGAMVNGRGQRAVQWSSCAAQGESPIRGRVITELARGGQYAAETGHDEEGRVRDADPPFFVGSSRRSALSFMDHPLTRMIDQRAPRTRA